MMWRIWRDRRQDPSQDDEKRKAQRRKAQRRKYLRIWRDRRQDPTQGDEKRKARRRKAQRRKNSRIWRDRRQDPTQEDEKRTSYIRKPQIKKYSRIFYPQASAPKVLNAGYRIVNISQEGILFVCEDGSDQCSRPIALRALLDLKVQFHDGVTLDMQVRITRCQSCLNSSKNFYAGTIKQGISAERITKEQAYVQKLFPNLSGAPRDSSAESREALLVCRKED
jgi:hypothetical protein